MLRISVVVGPTMGSHENGKILLEMYICKSKKI